MGPFFVGTSNGLENFTWMKTKTREVVTSTMEYYNIMALNELTGSIINTVRVQVGL